MSFIITVYTNEGIIMASDSRITYNQTTTMEDGTVQTNYGIQFTDTTYKTFICNPRIGISICGDSSINNKPIAGYIENFISEKVDETSTVSTISNNLIDYFNHFTPIPNSTFIVAGYDRESIEPNINRVYTQSGEIVSVDTANAGAIWNGETEVLAKLVNPVAVKNDDGSYLDLQCNNIGFNFFTLQDAINFAEYAVDVTIKTMSFQDCVKTVGGPIDILALKPTGATWIQHKELHA